MIYLGLGANLGDRRGNLRNAIGRLSEKGFAVTRVSPVIETPAMLPDNAESDWNRPYLNCVVEAESDRSPRMGLEAAKQIEEELGRAESGRWAPRTIDIDLLLWHDRIVNEPDLRIPHYGIAERSFVLTPLAHLGPGRIIPGLGKSVMELSRETMPVPLWMGILNLTPDSFSNDGLSDSEDILAARIDEFLDQGVQIIDVGAESTRPKADSVSPDEEWSRLKPALGLIRSRIRDKQSDSRISVDSRNWQTLGRALEYGVDYINDVTGLTDPRIQGLAREGDCDVIAMHSMTVPVDPSRILASSLDAFDQIDQWIGSCKMAWLESGLDLDRIIIDPGIGFGKTPLQSLELLQRCGEFRKHGFRLLIGHSRKSFMERFSEGPAEKRDPETLGISLGLCTRGVDMIRVHDPCLHMRAYRAWQHVSGSHRS